MPFRVYTVDRGAREMYVFYCLWEDRTPQAGFATASLTYQSRFATARAGQRNLGQRSIELAVSEFVSVDDAEAAVLRQLREMIKVNGT